MHTAAKRADHRIVKSQEMTRFQKDLHISVFAHVIFLKHDTGAGREGVLPGLAKAMPRLSTPLSTDTP
jgi:hypothetical protein